MHVVGSTHVGISCYPRSNISKCISISIPGFAITVPLVSGKTVYCFGKFQIKLKQKGGYQAVLSAISVSGK